MFVEISKNVFINTDHIVWIENDKIKMSDGTVHYFAEDCTKNVGERLELINQLIFK